MNKSQFALGTFGLLFLCLFMYGCIYIGKNLSYNFFYEDLVIETIQEQTKKECLK